MVKVAARVQSEGADGERGVGRRMKGGKQAMAHADSKGEGGTRRVSIETIYC